MSAIELLFKFATEHGVSLVLSYEGCNPNYKLQIIRNNVVHTVFLDVRFLAEIGDNLEFFEYFLNHQLDFLELKEAAGGRQCGKFSERQIYKA